MVGDDKDCERSVLFMVTDDDDDEEEEDEDDEDTVGNSVDEATFSPPVVNEV